MDYKKYIIMFLICFCIGMSLWMGYGWFVGVPQSYIGAGFGFGVGYTGAEMMKDYFKVRKNAKTENKP